MNVKFIYKDGFVKYCSRKEAEVLEKLGRGKIEGDKPAPKVEAPKTVVEVKPVAEVKLVETPKAEEVFKPAAPEPVKRRGRPPKA